MYPVHLENGEMTNLVKMDKARQKLSQKKR